MIIDRHGFLKLGSLSLLAVTAPQLRAAFAQAPKADYTVEIANGLAEYQAGREAAERSSLRAG